MMYVAYTDSSVGALTLANADGATLSGFWIDGQEYDHTLLKEEVMREYETDSLAIFRKTTRRLELYLPGQESNFYPRLSFSGSEFREGVAQEVLSAPYGCTASYKQLAKNLAVRQGKNYVSPHMTGSTVAHNSLLVLILCHRIIGTDGHLTGYAGEFEREKYLLALGAG